MPKGPFDPKGGLIGRLFTIHPVERETRVRGRHTVFISEEVGFRDLGATRGCADYMAEFSTYTTFAAKPNEMQTETAPGEFNEAEFLDCPDPFAILLPSTAPTAPPPPFYGFPYNPGSPLPTEPQGPGQQE
jgi:hypothetical protein